MKAFLHYVRTLGEFHIMLVCRFYMTIFNGFTTIKKECVKAVFANYIRNLVEFYIMLVYRFHMKIFNLALMFLRRLKKNVLKLLLLKVIVKRKITI